MVAIEWNTWSYVYLGLLVASVLVAGAAAVRIARRPAPAAPAAPTAAPTGDAAEGRTLAEILAGGAGAEPYLAQFVLDAKGERVGETIGVAGERIVLKRDGRFLSVPLAQVRVRGGSLVASENVDWPAAERAGEAWRASGEDAIRYDASGMPVKDEPR